MNLQRREEIRKMCAEPARGGIQGAKQIFDLRDAVNELLAHIDTLEQMAAERVIASGKARAVVVPEPSDDDLSAVVYDVGGDPSNSFERALVHSGYRWACQRSDALRANHGGTEHA